MSKRPVISIIDDDASVRVAISNLVRSHDYIVHIFASAEEFLQSGQVHDTSCVIADVHMPVISGVELLEFLHTEGHGVPFIFIRTKN